MRDGHRRLQGAVGFAVILAASLIGYGQLLAPGRFPYSPHSDIVAYHLAVKHVLHRSLEAGRGLPYWRSDQLSGTPAFTDPSALYTNPLHGLYHLWDPLRATGPTLFLTLIVGAFSFYMVAASLGLGRWSRLFVALAGLFSFKVIVGVYAGWLALLCGIVSFPLLFASAFALVNKPGHGPALALAASGALCLHSGQLQVVYYAAWFVFAYLFVACLQGWRGGRGPEARRLTGYVVVAALLALAMSLYLLLPLAAEAPLVSRARATDSFLRSTHMLGLRHLLTFLAPEALGTPLDGSYPSAELWEDVAYFGLLPLLLASVGACLGWHRSQTRFLLAGFGLSLVLALDSPIVRIAYAAVPGMRLFRLHGRFLFLTAFFGIALAGIGFEELHRRMQGRRLARWLPAALILIVTGEGIFYAHRYVRTEPASVVEPDTGYARWLASDPSVFRCAPIGRSALAYGAAAGQNLQLITGYEPYNLSRYQDYMAIMQTGATGPKEAVVWTDILAMRRWDLLDTLNVKYLLSSWRLDLPEERFRLVRRFDNQPVFVFYVGIRRAAIWLYENTRARPRAYFADDIEWVADERAASRRVAQASLEGVTVVLDPNAGEYRRSRASQQDRASVAGAADGVLRIDTRSATQRFLVVSEIWHPGWRGFVDGKEVPLRQADVALLGAWIPAGTHRFELLFRPLRFRFSCAMSFLAFVIFSGASAWCWLGRGRLHSARLPQP